MSEATPGLVVDDLARRYGQRWAVARVSFAVPPGTACQITGPNGSGKSTLLRCLATALQPNHGDARLDGRSLWEHRAALRPSVAFLSHASRLYEDLSARDNVAAWARLGGYPLRQDALIERVGLDPARPDPVSAFSAGMRRRLALAIALMKKPKMLLLDEPFAALDPVGREVVLDIVREVRDAGAVVILATHLPQQAGTVCSQTIRLEAGRRVSA